MDWCIGMIKEDVTILTQTKSVMSEGTSRQKSADELLVLLCPKNIHVYMCMGP